MIMHRVNHGGLFLVQMMAQNLRGEMSSDFAGTKLCLSDSRFIQVIAKSLSISCKEVRTLFISPNESALLSCLIWQ